MELGRHDLLLLKVLETSASPGMDDQNIQVYA